MQNAFIRWLSGNPPASVGAWVGGSGACLVRMDREAELCTESVVVYEPSGMSLSDGAVLSESQYAESINALRCAFKRLGSGSFALALGIPSADIFTKWIEIPSGLSDKQVAQLSVVEAVSNLPVPPEEVSSDFVRTSTSIESTSERVDIAFCRREVIDQLSVLSEDAGVRLAIVDRDIQAIHDAAQWYVKQQGEIGAVRYPLGILILADAVTFLVCRSVLDLTSYQLTIDRQDIDREACAEALALFCKRAGLSEGSHGYLTQLVVFSEAQEFSQQRDDYKHIAAHVDAMNPHCLMGSKADGVPLYGLMVATGMALR